MAKILLLNVDVINGEVQDKPVPFYFNTDIIKPVGITIVRWFDFNQCSLATKAFIFEYEGNTFGTWQFKTWEDFWRWFNGGILETLVFLLNGETMLLNSEEATYTV